MDLPVDLPAVDTSDPCALLELAARGREEYAEGAPERIAEPLLTQAVAYRQAIKIIQGDRWALEAALPSWRWHEIPRAREDA